MLKSRPRSSTRKRKVYWCVNYKDRHTSKASRCTITCDTSTTFDQLLQRAKEATDLLQITAFRCMIGPCKTIHDDQSMAIAMEAFRSSSESLEHWRVGIMIYVIEENHRIDSELGLVSALFLMFIGYGYMYLMYLFIMNYVYN